jgi:hypothetical protein
MGSGWKRRWLDGKNPDHYSTSLAIEKILAEGFPASWRRKRVAGE